MKWNHGKCSKGYSAAGSIIGIAFVIYIFISIAAMIYYSKRVPMMCLFIFGTYFMAFGILSLTADMDSKGIKKNLLTVVTFAVGLGVMILSGITMWGARYNIVLPKKTAPVLGLSIFIIAGAGMIIYPLVTFYKRKGNWDIVNAQCVGLNRRYSRSSHGSPVKIYCPVFSYSYNGKEYTAHEGSYSNIDIPKEGTYHDIYINPDDPEQIYRFSIKGIIINLIVGFVFIIPAAIGIYNIFK